MHLRLPRPGPAALVALASLAVSTAQAQIGRPGVEPARPTVYAITNARIVPVSGPEIPRGTVVVRDGLITAVGPTVAAPADARVIDGNGLTVYPGFIDGYTNLGIPAPAQQAGGGGGGGGNAQLLAMLGGQTQQQGQPGAVPNSRYPVGLQPEVTAVELMRIEGDPFDAARSAGIATALVAPRTGIFAGTSALVSLIPDVPQDIIVRSPAALHVGFTPTRGGYPGSLLGVFSALRQMLYDAKRYGEVQAAYSRSPRGMRRPETDLSLAALQPVLSREVPVVMQASTQREIERALDLAREFNLRAVIAGGAEAHLVAARLKAENVPVIATLNFPRAPQGPRAADADPEPVRVLRERADAPKNAGRLAAAGVSFAFTSGGATMTDVLPALQRTTENGLAKDRALRALTLDAAQILGVADRMGSIEPGKAANLTITRGDVFERTSRVAHVMVDGRLFDVRQATASAGRGGNAGNAGSGGANAPDANAPATGQWLLTVTMGGQDKRVTLDLQQEGERLRGSIQGALGSAQIANASFSNGEFRFTASVTTDETHEATFTGTLTGNQMRGTVAIVGETPGTFIGSRPQGGRP